MRQWRKSAKIEIPACAIKNKLRAMILLMERIDKEQKWVLVRGIVAFVPIVGNVNKSCQKNKDALKIC